MAVALSAPGATSFSFSSLKFNTNLRLPKLSFPKITLPKIGGLNIRCVRIGGVEIPKNKRIEFSLQYIHGIGRSLSRDILNDLGFENKMTKDLTEEEVIQLRNEINNYRIEGDLRRYNKACITRLIDLGTYRGYRHVFGMPCRGQRTRKNGNTLKRKRFGITKKKPGKK